MPQPVLLRSMLHSEPRIDIEVNNNGEVKSNRILTLVTRIRMCIGMLSAGLDDNSSNLRMLDESLDELEQMANKGDE